MTIRVGLGRSDTGKTLDYGAQWYNYDTRTTYEIIIWETKLRL